MKRLPLVLLALTLLSPLVSAAPRPQPAPPVRNVVLFIGDGLGVGERAMARLVQNGPLAMDAATAWALTTPASTDGPAPDSAAACTALATGHKTVRGQVATDADGKPLTTLFEAARKTDRSTGLVTNLLVSHSAVAGFYTHSPRDKEAAIELKAAGDAVASGPDVLLGGGERFFLPTDRQGYRQDSRDLEAEARTHGYQVVHTRTELQQASSGSKLLGLFAPGAMAYEIDRKTDADTQPTLAEMTTAALRRLAATPAGFVLVVDQGHLDWACHDHDPATALREVVALDDAVKAAQDFAHGRHDTLLLVVASHDTAGLALGPGFQADILRSARNSLEKVATAVRKDRGHYETTLATLLGWTDLRTEEKEQIVLASDPDKASAEEGSGLDPLVLALGGVLDQRAGVGWASGDHTGNPCPLTAAGAGAHAFAGAYDTTEVPRRVAHLMGLELP